MTADEQLMVFLVIAAFGFFLLFLYSRYSSMKTWAEGQRRIMEIEDKRLELQQQKDLLDSVREELVQIGDVDDLEEAYEETIDERDCGCDKTKRMEKEEK